MRHVAVVLGCVFALWLLPGICSGQAVYGSIAGTVTDSSGAAVPNAKVTIRDVGKGVTYTTTTNEAGNYSQIHLIVGVYEVRVEAPGFDTFVQQNVNVDVDATAPVNAQLHPGKIGETVTVTGGGAAQDGAFRRLGHHDAESRDGAAGVFARREPALLPGSGRPGDRHHRSQRAAA